MLQWHWVFNSCTLEKLFKITVLCFIYNTNQIFLAWKLFEVDKHGIN